MSEVNVKDVAEKLRKFPFTRHFRVKDTVGVPHPYCITPKHLALCESGILDEHSIKRAEEKGARCDICKGKLSFEEHKQALVVAVYDEHEVGLNEIEGLGEYLESIKELTESEGYEGWCFIESKFPHDEGGENGSTD